MDRYPRFQKIGTFLRTTASYFFGLDTRALAAWRILLGILIIIDLCTNMTWLRAFYSDAGILPTDVLQSLYPTENLRSIHNISWSERYVLCIFLIHLWFAFALTIGYKTRVATIATWALLLSLHARNPMILNGGDFVLKMLLFWGMFLPWWARWSIDAIRYKQDPAQQYVGPWTVALLTQLCLIYILSAVLKTDPIRTKDFSATYYALSLDIFTNPFGQRFAQHYSRTQLMTQAVFLLEKWWFLLLFIPWKINRRRTIGVGIFILFHLWLISMMKIWLFPRICISAWIMILPKPVWDRLEHTRPYQTLRLLFPHRPTTPAETHRLWFRGKLFVRAALAYVICWNIRTTDFDRHRSWFPYEINRFGQLLRLDQYRNMFAPYPLLDDGWFVVIGNTYDQKEINVREVGAPLPRTKPHDLYRMFPNDRRRKYMTNIWMKDNAEHRVYYANYLCRAYNHQHPLTEALSSVHLLFMLEESKPYGQPTTIERVDLGTFPCPMV